MKTDRARLYRWQIARAKEVDESLRERAFLPLTESINGVIVNQFTLRHLTILFHLQSPFIYGGVRKIEDVGQFLWVVSPFYQARPETVWLWKPEFVADTAWNRIRRMVCLRMDRLTGRKFGMVGSTTRQVFLAEIVNHPRWERFYRAIDRYLQRTFRDPPPTTKNGKHIATCYTASVLHPLMKNYGGTEEEWMDKPLVRVFQFMKWLQAEDDPKTPQFSPTVAVVENRFCP